MNPQSERSDSPTELDEATAVALCILIDNQIAALEAWKRKLKLPFMPNASITYIHMQVPPYPKPTVQTATHIGWGLINCSKEVVRIITQYHKERHPS